MSKYTFTFKKDDISVEFTTTDKEAVASQFKIWVDSATEYTKAHPIEEKKTLDEVKKTIEPLKTESNTEKSVEVQPEIKQEPDNFDKAQELLKQVEQKDIQVQNEQPQQEPQPEIEVPNQTQEIPDIENNDNKEGDIQTPSTPAVTINSIQNPTPPQEQNAPDFDKVLEQKIENPTFVPESNKDTRFIDFLNAKNTKDKLHYLIITAFYFLQFDRVERFSLKQINSKLMHNISELIDHSIIQEAMNRQLIEIVPDLTGASEVSEYRLTEKGEDFFINGLN